MKTLDTATQATGKAPHVTGMPAKVIHAVENNLVNFLWILEVLNQCTVKIEAGIKRTRTPTPGIKSKTSRNHAMSMNAATMM
jgi:hypothetical protein